MRMVVGAPYNDGYTDGNGRKTQGAAYVYHRSGRASVYLDREYSNKHGCSTFLFICYTCIYLHLCVHAPLSLSLSLSLCMYMCTDRTLPALGLRLQSSWARASRRGQTLRTNRSSKLNFCSFSFFITRSSLHSSVSSLVPFPSTPPTSPTFPRRACLCVFCTNMDEGLGLAQRGEVSSLC